MRDLVPPTSFRRLLGALALGAIGSLSGRSQVGEKLLGAGLHDSPGKAQPGREHAQTPHDEFEAPAATMTVEMGAALIDEQEMGLPYYPGARPVAGKSNRMLVNEMKMVQVEFSSSDGPKRVAAWYRDKLKPLGVGRQVMDQSDDKDMLISLSDQATDEGFMVQVSAAEGGSQISLMHSLKGARI